MGCLDALTLLLLLLLLVSLSLASPLHPTGLSTEDRGRDREFAEAYLEKFYGYEGHHRGLQKRSCQPDPFQTKVREMQRAFGLHESGELTAQTLTAMRRPRCGLSDAEEFGPLMRWINRTLTYRIEGSVPTVRPSHMRRAFGEAWKLWSEVTPLKFRRRSRREADIIVTFTKRDHGDGSSFDGRGGILAHAFQPGTGIGGDVHFDAEEDWTVSTKGHNLFAVAVHEFGHTLGLPHSPDPGAVMYPAYNFVTHSDFQLSFQDVKDIQKMYGVHPDFNLMALKRPPPKTPERCDPDLTFDAVCSMQQEVVFFKDRFMWRSHPQFDMIGVAFISSLWEDVPSHIDAAYEDVEGGTMLFFKGTQYWEVSGMTLQENSPKNITELGLPRILKAIDAAFHLRFERQTVFFAGRVCWRYDNERHRMMDGYPKLITLEWPGLSGPIDGAVMSNGEQLLYRMQTCLNS
ncbi:neutrophil collagenase [Alosa sapidissima]|uniref:neutrophil collagenase n=1 Tax=Alosa sapidissima TaxID=34773 RepID=UPI001C0A6085|nr:neutrophil collagenase [Alosa sapidissima]